MDSKGFRTVGQPNLVAQPSPSRIDRLINTMPKPQISMPSRDSRYSAFAAPMEDGRLVTDYRQNCVSRVGYGSQNAVKQWMIHNAEQIMDLSIARQAETTGGGRFPSDTPIPNAAVIQHTTVRGSEMIPTNDPTGLGLEREGQIAPPLFGTFTFYDKAGPTNRKNISLTNQFEGGRNTANRWNYKVQECPK